VQTVLSHLIALLMCAATTANAAEELTPLTIPVRIHLIQCETETALNTTLTEEDVKRVLGKVNKIWAQAGIKIEVESICKTKAAYDAALQKDPTDRWVVASIPKDCALKNGVNIYYVKELTPNGFYANGSVYVKDTAKLVEVPNGVDEPLPRVTSHELGHALGLPHRQDLTNLMASGKTGFTLNDSEIETARKTAVAKFGQSKKEETKEVK
jgi:hypothetical protein